MNKSIQAEWADGHYGCGVTVITVIIAALGSMP